VVPAYFGDANLDGHVDLTDLATILNNFGATTGAWTSGNFDGNPTIDLTDFADVLNNFGATNPNLFAASPSSQSPVTNDQLPAAAPEPASLLLLLLPLLTRTQRKSNNR